MPLKSECFPRFLGFSLLFRTLPLSPSTDNCNCTVSFQFSSTACTLIPDTKTKGEMRVWGSKPTKRTLSPFLNTGAQLSGLEYFEYKRVSAKIDSLCFGRAEANSKNRVELLRSNSSFRRSSSHLYALILSEQG